jgi:hypothetical protein
LLLAALGVRLSGSPLAVARRAQPRRRSPGGGERHLSDREGNPPRGPLVLPASSGGRVGGWGWARVREVRTRQGLSRLDRSASGRACGHLRRSGWRLGRPVRYLSSEMPKDLAQFDGAADRHVAGSDGWHELAVANPTFLLERLGSECTDLQGLQHSGLRHPGHRAAAANSRPNTQIVIKDCAHSRVNAVDLPGSRVLSARYRLERKSPGPHCHGLPRAPVHRKDYRA